MQGMTLGYGGNPYGPAGTGKTETVKALGQALARQVKLNAFALMMLACCIPSSRGETYTWDVLTVNQTNTAVQVLVFNCDGDFDFKSMSRIFMGLVKCGAWGCFDEFNRLDEDVLSAVSQQVQLIQVC